MVNALIVIQLLNGQQPAQLLEPCTCELTGQFFTTLYLKGSLKQLTLHLPHTS